MTLFFATFKSLINEVKLGLDLQGGFEILYEVQDPYEEQEILNEDLLKQTASLIHDRINLLGISEPTVTIEDESRIRVQIPGVKDQEEMRTFISIGGNITVRDTEDSLVLSSTDFDSIDIEPSSREEYPIVTMDLSDSVDIEKITQKYENDNLAFWLDFEQGDSYKVEAAKENSKIFFDGKVSGNWSDKSIALAGEFTKVEAELVAKTISTGDLPAPLEEVYSRSVSGQLGKVALTKTIISGIIGMVLISSYMMWRYRWLGLLTVLCLISYLYLTIAIFVFLEGVLTLTGLAAFILGLGIAVDATIIKFERLKEQIEPEKSFEQSVMEASNKSFKTIGDSQLTTLIAAAGLFLFGVGMVKGFATMLFISIISGFLTCYALLRLLLYMVGETRVVEWWQSKKKEY
ncbi:SecD/SecF fusion protein [Bacillus sp. es.036]|nr:SecD/SecF fusion protein [Bacillus sp. es.036]